MIITEFNPEIIKRLYQPAADSHKGQNGRLLVIGGSKLFHTSIFWAAEVASKMVDLVHFTSPANENNELVRQKIKSGFWEGIVVDWGQVDDYIREDDSVLIGPGMERGKMTRQIINDLLTKYPDKRWVVDGGALQEVEPRLLNGNMIITPHQGEFARLASKIQDTHATSSGQARYKIQDWNNIEERAEKTGLLSKQLDRVTILTKGQIDVVCRGEEVVVVAGGNAGMTKGGTGDVLAGLVAGLYCKNEAFLAAQVGSYVNKKAGEALAEKVGEHFNAQDLVGMVPSQLHQVGAYIEGN